MFFTFSGLNTQLTMVNTAPLLLIALGVLAASIFAKFVACWAAARARRPGQSQALGIGALMNARGLTELIILNIGLQAGIIGPALFSMLVLMAIVTTLMASPLFERVYGRGRARKALAAGHPPLSATSISGALRSKARPRQTFTLAGPPVGRLRARDA